MTTPRQHLSPPQGGCWFCSMDQCDHFSTSFDTYLHMDCLLNALRNMKSDCCDEEADIMAEEFGIPYETL